MHIYTKLTSLLWCLWFAYWLAVGFNTKRTVHRENILARFIIGLSFYLTFQLIYSSRLTLGLPERLLIPHTHAWGVLGVLLTALGIALSIWARVALGVNWSGQPELKHDHELVTHGPYRWTRHPIYTWLLLAAFGTALTVGMPRAFVGVVQMFAGFWYKLTLEERLMLKQFPAEYPVYRRRTKAIIPFIL